MEFHAVVIRCHVGRLIVQNLRLLPWEALIREVAVLGCAAIDWVGQVEFLHDDTRSHVEILLDDFY